MVCPYPYDNPLCSGSPCPIDYVMRHIVVTELPLTKHFV